MAADTNDIARLGTPEDWAARAVGAGHPGHSLAKARAAQGLSLDDLTLRTCIRPGILRRIEADDFEACGGDFYARGHLRILGSALHLDVEALLAAFDQEHPDQADSEADAPLDLTRAPRVGGAVSLLVGAIMIILLCLLLVVTLNR